jgi:hypothetical protein
MWTKEKQKEYNKKYRLENKEKVKKIQDDYYIAHREERIANSKKWVANNSERAKNTRKEYRNTKHGKLKSIINSAKYRKINFYLTSDDVYKILDGDCHYCGKATANGIDRLNSEIGYENGNCVPCCTMCNYMKRDFSYEMFIEQCRKIVNYI